MSEDFRLQSPMLRDASLPRQSWRSGSADVKLFLYRPRGWSVLEIDGELDLCCVPRLRDVLATAGSRVILDLSGVTFIDASGLGVFAAAAERALRVGGAVRVVGASQQVARLVILTRLDRVLPLYDSMKEALDEAGLRPLPYLASSAAPAPGGQPA
jgi:anti-sigma B factor antagonist